jgi:hypothetical protein
MSKAPKDYSKTKIYRIPVGDENYYGHTTQPLHKRKQGHKDDFKRKHNRNLYKAMREAKMDATDIELIWVEDFPCKSVYEAKARERYWVENYGSLNMTIPNQTESERQKQRYMLDEEYRSKKQQLSKNRYEMDTTYRTATIERVKEWKKQKGREILACDACGKKLTRNSITRHQKENCKGKTLQYSKE